MFDKDALYQNIKQQTRNGRQEIYLPIEIIKEFDPSFESNESYAFVNVSLFRSFEHEYEKDSFKNSLKVDISNNRTSEAATPTTDKTREER